MALIPIINDLSLHEQIPHFGYLGIRRTRQINAVNNDTNTRRQRLNCQARTGQRGVSGMDDRGIPVTDSLCYVGSLGFVLDHTVRVGAGAARRIFLPVSPPGVRATPCPAVGTVLRSIHSTGLKDLFHRYRHSSPNCYYRTPLERS